MGDLDIIETMLKEKGMLKNKMSKWYKILGQKNEDLECWRRWEIYEQRKILQRVHTSSIATVMEEINYKLLMRWHLTPERIKRYVQIIRMNVGEYVVKRAHMHIFGGSANTDGSKTIIVPL